MGTKPNKMKRLNKIIASVLLLIAIYIPSGVIVAEAPAAVKSEYTKEELVELTYKYANMYNVSGDYMVRLINCENREWDVDLQSRIKYNFSNSKRGIVYGEYELSFGLSQIHLPDHPEVTYEQAIDPIYSIEFMAKKLSTGQNIWYCKNKI